LARVLKVFEYFSLIFRQVNPFNQAAQAQLERLRVAFLRVGAQVDA
jgi:hypothetical protein